MRVVLATISILLTLLVLVPVVLVFALPSNEPRVEIAAGPSHADVRRIKEILKENNPLRIRRQQRRFIELNEHDVNLLMRHGLNRFGPVAVRVGLAQESATVEGSYRLPENPLGRYLNFEATLAEREPWIRVTGLKVGSIPLPGFLAQMVFGHLETIAEQRFPEYREVKDVIQAVQFADNKLIVAYDWHPDLIRRLQAQAGSGLVPDAQKERLAIYHHHLALFTYRVRWQPYSLDKLLRHMFELAAKRTLEGQDPVEENRAVFLVLGVYGANVPLHRFLRGPDGRPLLFARFTRGSLNNRHDLMQHFLVSAGLTVTTGTELADVIGLAKELDDSMGGSGFSFADLLADRAGVRMGKVAVSSAASARKLQSMLTDASLSEADFMPSIARLPEGLTEEQFKATYRDVNSEAYRVAENEIHARISACRIYRETGDG